MRQDRLILDNLLHLKQVNYAKNEFFIDQTLLNLRELEDNRDEAGQVSFGLCRYLKDIFEAVESDSDNVLIKHEVLRLLVRENNQEGLDNCVSQLF